MLILHCKIAQAGWLAPMIINYQVLPQILNWICALIVIYSWKQNTALCRSKSKILASSIQRTWFHMFAVSSDRVTMVLLDASLINTLLVCSVNVKERLCPIVLQPNYYKKGLHILTLDLSGAILSSHYACARMCACVYMKLKMFAASGLK